MKKLLTTLALATALLAACGRGLENPGYNADAPGTLDAGNYDLLMSDDLPPSPDGDPADLVALDLTVQGDALLSEDLIVSPGADLTVPLGSDFKPPPPDLAVKVDIITAASDLAKPPSADLIVPPGSDLKPPPADLKPYPDLILITPASCSDGVQNGAETDKDCGGGTCPVCADGKKCKVNTDCTSLACGGGICKAATCTDGIKNAAETDADCGGGTCPKCADGKACQAAGDCTSGVCTGGKCQTPTCADGVKNGIETDLDCGGDVCRGANPPKLCGANKACKVPEDCESVGCPKDPDKGNLFCAPRSTAFVRVTAKGNATIMRCVDGNTNTVDLPVPTVGVWTRVDGMRYCFFVNSAGQYAGGVTGEVVGWDALTRGFCNNLNGVMAAIGFNVAVYDPSHSCSL